MIIALVSHMETNGSSLTRAARQSVTEMGTQLFLEVSKETWSSVVLITLPSSVLLGQGKNKH